MKLVGQWLATARHSILGVTSLRPYLWGRGVGLGSRSDPGYQGWDLTYGAYLVQAMRVLAYCMLGERLIFSTDASTDSEFEHTPWILGQRQVAVGFFHRHRGPHQGHSYW